MRRLRQRRRSAPRCWRVHAMIWSARSRRALLLMQGQDELKRRTGPLITESRQASPVSFHDRTTDREPHAQATGLCGEKGFEQLVRIFDRKSRHRSPSHLEALAVRLILARSDHQFARPIPDSSIASMPFITRLMITCCSWTRSPGIIRWSRCQFGSQRYPVAAQLTLHQRDDLPDDVIEVERQLLHVGLFRERPDTSDHLACPVAVVRLTHSTERRAAARSGVSRSSQRRAGLGVSDHRGERLVHFMSDGGRQFAQRRHPRDMREFRSRLAQLLLGLFRRSDIVPPPQ